MDLLTIICIAGVLCLGSCIQTAIGFAFGLFAIPLLILIGLEPQHAIPIVGVSAFVQMIIGVIHHRESLPWRQMGWFILLAIAAQPLGVWILGQIVQLEREQIRQIFGVLVLLVLAVKWWARPIPQEKLHPIWAVIALPAAGIMSGMAGMPGPPVVIWVMAHSWNPHRSRATLWLVFLCLGPSNLFFLSLQFGHEVWKYALYGLCFLPAVGLGALPGFIIGGRITKHALQRTAMAILLLICLFAIGQPLL